MSSKLKRSKRTSLPVLLVAESQRIRWVVVAQLMQVAVEARRGRANIRYVVDGVTELPVIAASHRLPWRSDPTIAKSWRKLESTSIQPNCDAAFDRSISVCAGIHH